jgi:hypothetical protein
VIAGERKLGVEEVVAILRELAEEGDAEMARSHGDEALGVAQALRTAVATHFEEETPYGEVWQHFEEAPDDGEDELAGELEATVEADTALAQTLDQLLQEYYQLIGPAEARLPEDEWSEDGFSVSGEEDEPPNEPSEVELEGETTYLYDELAAGSESIGSEIGENEEEDTDRVPISLFGPDAETAKGIYKELYAAVDAYPDLSLELRMEIKEVLEAIEDESAQGRRASEERLGRQLAKIHEIAPDLLELFLPVLTDPGEKLNRALRAAAEKMAQTLSSSLGHQKRGS